MDACDDKVMCAANHKSLRPSGTKTLKSIVYMCVHITQSEVKVELIASFISHSNLVGSEISLNAIGMLATKTMGCQVV